MHGISDYKKLEEGIERAEREIERQKAAQLLNRTTFPAVQVHYIARYTLSSLSNTYSALAIMNINVGNH